MLHINKIAATVKGFKQAFEENVDMCASYYAHPTLSHVHDEV